MQWANPKRCGNKDDYRAPARITVDTVLRLIMGGASSNYVLRTNRVRRHKHGHGSCSTGDVIQGSDATSWGKIQTLQIDYCCASTSKIKGQAHGRNINLRRKRHREALEAEREKGIVVNASELIDTMRSIFRYPSVVHIKRGAYGRFGLGRDRQLTT